MGLLMAFSPNGKLLAAIAPGASVVQLWKLATGKPAGTLSLAGLQAVAFSPDGDVLAAAVGSDGTVRLWNLTTHQPLGKPMAAGAVDTLAGQVAFVPNGVNCINPGPTDTGWADETVTGQVVERMPQRRWGMPDDAARLVAWLLSADAQWVCGQTLNSEGGFGR